VDRDIVDRTNLNRQVLHWESDIGELKARSAEAKLREARPSTRRTSGTWSPVPT